MACNVQIILDNVQIILDNIISTPTLSKLEHRNSYTPQLRKKY